MFVFKKIFLIPFLLVCILFTSCTSLSVNTSSEDVPLTINPSIKNGKLSNGLDYYILQNKEPSNKIILRLLVKAGACMEDSDQKGVAHFIEHMCFDGSEHFENKEIISFCESIGMNYGNDLNAYTYQDKTVYCIAVPADNPEYLKKALTWFYDIACTVSFNPENLENEKGIVIEEWRRDQGLDTRYKTAVVDKFYAKDSLFENCPVLGTSTSIRDVSRERVIDFYKKWYRPDNMSLVAVGDFSVPVVEKAIKEAMSSIQKPSSELTKLDLSIPFQEKSVILFTDEEQKDSCINIEERIRDYRYLTTEKDIKDYFARIFVSNALNERMNEGSKEIGCPYFAGGCTEYMFTYSAWFRTLYVQPKDNKFEESLKVLLDEVNRLKKYGITESEFYRMKENTLASLNATKKNIDKIDSVSKANGILSYILCGTAVMDSNEAIRVNKKAASSLTIEDVNKSMQSMFTSKGDLLLIRANSSKLNSINKEKLTQIWNSYESEVSEYSETIDSRPIMQKPAKKASIKSKKTNRILGTTEYILQNDVKIITKKTSFEKDTIKMRAYSAGGLSLVSDEDYPSACASVTYVFQSGVNGFTISELNKKLNGINMSCSLNFYDYKEALSGLSSNKDFEFLLQFISAVFTKPDFTEEGWNLTMLKYSEALKNRSITVNDVLCEKINECLYGNDIRKNDVTQEFFDMLDKKKAEKIFKERFSNAGDYTFTFAGDFDEKKLIDLCCWYLGNLPSTGEKEIPVWRENDFPKGKIEESVVKGKDSNSNVYLAFGSYLPTPETALEKEKLIQISAALSDYLTTKLTEAIREDKSGTYSINSNINLIVNPQYKYTAEIYFGCQTGREKELLQAVFDKLNELKTTPISDEDLEKLKEAFKVGYEENCKTNEWWLNRINNILILECEVPETVKDKNMVLSWYTKENIQELMNKYFDEDNYVVVIQKPE